MTEVTLLVSSVVNHSPCLLALTVYTMSYACMAVHIYGTDLCHYNAYPVHMPASDAIVA